MFFDTARTLKRRVRYFFSAPDAKLFPGGTVFSSGNWGHSSSNASPLGEDPASIRTYSKGQRPAGMDGTGNFCGPREWWSDGCPSDAPPVQLVDGVASCCLGNLYLGTAGVKFGAESPALCQPMINWALAEMLYPDGTWRKPDNIGFFANPTWNMGLYNIRYTVFIQGFLTQSAPNCAQFRLQILFRDRSEAVPMTNLGPDPDHAGAYVWYGSYTFGPFFDEWKRSIRFVAGIQQGRAGVKFGAVSAAPHAGRAGVKLGAVSEVLGIVEGTAGVKLGAVSALLAMVEGTAGVAFGAVSEFVVLYEGTAGVKFGAVSALLAMVEGTAGVKFGAESVAKVTVEGTAGVKFGAVSTAFAGVLTNCCTGTAIPRTLNGIGSGGTPFSCTYNGTTGWPFTDPDGLGLGFTLQCVLTGGVWKWQATSGAGGGCTKTYTEISKVCNPFAVSVRTVLAGGSCPFAGTYDFSFSA